MMTAEEIEAGKTAKGGWTRETLASWGVPWPPPKGWRKRLIEGTPAAGGSVFIAHIMQEVFNEVQEASDKWPPFNSAHEGFAVLQEEVDELWDHVKVNQKRRDLDAMRREAVQVAAMAVRFALNICDQGRGRA